MKTYLVGGAVRDSVLGLEIKDRDYVVVDGSADELLAAGFSCVGQGFPVYLHPDTQEEYALARCEKKTAPGYTGFEFDTAGVSLEDDLMRRDLTINAMAMDDDGTIIDPLGGLLDIKNKVLRHTSDAFSEDPLRVIRLARFYARYSTLGFTVAPATLDLCKRMVSHRERTLDQLPDERFWQELEKALTEDHPQIFIEFLWDIGAIKQVSFFRRMFGTDLSILDLENIQRLMLASKVLDNPKLQVDVISAWVAPVIKPISNSKMNSSRGGQLVLAIAAFRELLEDSSARAVLGLFHKIKAFSEGNRAENFLDALGVWEFANLQPAHPISSQKLRSAMSAARTVTSEPFIHLLGPEIGIKMNLARIEKIKSTIQYYELLYPTN